MSANVVSSFDYMGYNRSAARSESTPLFFQVLRLLSLIFACAVGVSSQGTVMTFELDPSLSQLTLSGLVDTATFAAQASGALTAQYSGTIKADVTGTTIQFTGGSVVIAQNSGMWQPGVAGVLGFAPAVYGATNDPDLGTGVGANVPGNFAVRSLQMDLTSQVLNLNSGQFDGGSLVFSLGTNVVSADYYYSSQQAEVTNNGSSFWNGAVSNAQSTATLSTNLNTRELVIPINVTYQVTTLLQNASMVTLSGEWVARMLPPVIQSISKRLPDLELITSNTVSQSVLEVSTNLLNWTSASYTVSTNGLGQVVFTTPVPASKGFYRLKQ